MQTGNVLLQATKNPVVTSELTAGNTINAFLLTSILGLLIYIWKDNKASATEKHKDIIALIDTVKEEQDEIKKKQIAHDFQLYALNVAINLVQGKPYNYDNATIPKTKE